MQVINIPVEAWIPVRTYAWRDEIGECAKAVISLSEEAPDLIKSLDSKLSKVKASITSPPARVRKSLSTKSIIVHAGLTDFLRISAVYSFDPEEYRKANPGRDIDSEKWVVGASAAFALSDAIEVLLMLSEIALPGRVDAAEGVVRAKSGESARIAAKSSFPQLWFPDDGTPVWPPLTTLSLSEVLKWTRGTSFLRHALAVTRIERSFAAYTQMVRIGPYKEGEVLFRAMQALEAFYCDGTGDLRKQLAEKSAIWLGRWSEKKNIVGLLYDMRSKFVHGSSKLEYWKEYVDVWEEDEKHVRSFEYAVTLATRLVVATLQKCVVEQAQSVEWSYSVRVS